MRPRGVPRGPIRFADSSHEGECLNTRQKHIQETRSETQATCETALLRENRRQERRPSGSELAPQSGEEARRGRQTSGDTSEKARSRGLVEATFDAFTSRNLLKEGWHADFGLESRGPIRFAYRAVSQHLTWASWARSRTGVLGAVRAVSKPASESPAAQQPCSLLTKRFVALIQFVRLRHRFLRSRAYLLLHIFTMVLASAPSVHFLRLSRRHLTWSCSIIASTSTSFGT